MNAAACSASGVPGLVFTTCSNSSSAFAASPLLNATLAMPSAAAALSGLTASTFWNCASASATLPCAK
jgi:hypothetical protein